MTDAQAVGLVVVIAVALAPPALAFVAALLAPRHRTRIAQAASVPPGLLYLFVVFGSVFFPGPEGNHDDNAGGAAAMIFLPVLGIWLGAIWGAAYSAGWLRGEGRVQPASAGLDGDARR